MYFDYFCGDFISFLEDPALGTGFRTIFWAILGSSLIYFLDPVIGPMFDTSVIGLSPSNNRLTTNLLISGAAVKLFDSKFSSSNCKCFKWSLINFYTSAFVSLQWVKPILEIYFGNCVLAKILRSFYEEKEKVYNFLKQGLFENYSKELIRLPWAKKSNISGASNFGILFNLLFSTLIIPKLLLFILAKESIFSSKLFFN